MTMTLPLVAPVPKPDLLMAVAALLAVRIAAGTAITRQSLTADMTAAFGTDDTSGTWLLRDAYARVDHRLSAHPKNEAGGTIETQQLDQVDRRLLPVLGR